MNTNLNASAKVGDTFNTPITVYDSLGTSHNLTVTYTNTGANAWSYNISIPSADVGGTGTSTTVASGTMTFNSSGQLTSPTTPITGINITGRFQIQSAEGDFFQGTLFDQTGVGYRTSGQFDGKLFRFHSYDAPWRGDGILERQ